MSEGLRAIDKSASQNKSVKEKLRRYENVFDRFVVSFKPKRYYSIYSPYRNRECSLQEAAYR